jgi:hypothetical protein
MSDSDKRCCDDPCDDCTGKDLSGWIEKKPKPAESK